MEFKREVNEDFLNYMLFGTSHYFNVELLEDIISSSRLSREEVINRFKHQLTEEDLKVLNGTI